MNSDEGHFSVCIMEGVRKMLLSPVELVWLLSSLVEGSSGKAFATFVLRVHSMQELLSCTMVKQFVSVLTAHGGSYSIL